MPSPVTTVVFAMSADGKIADAQRRSGQLGTAADRAHLQAQVAQADAVLTGAGTLRSEHATVLVKDPQLLAERAQRGQDPQPVQIIASGSGEIDPELVFFQQPVRRWLLTTPAGRDRWIHQPDKFERFLLAPEATGGESPSRRGVDFRGPLAELGEAGIGQLVVLGGGDLVGSLLLIDAIDFLWLTVCPWLIGGASAPSPVDGAGLSLPDKARLRLQSVEQLGDELFLLYARQRETKDASA